MTSLENDIKSFADERWPNRDVPERLRKLGEEFGELAEAIARGDDAAAFLEAADCGIILADLLALKGKSLTVAMMIKMEINATKEVKP
jgi:NTP pyrophosphatase (non-canonical NTP hydrolase)